MPPRPSTEDALMIDPPPFLRIVRVTDFIPRKHPTWLMFTSCMYSSSGVHSSALKRRIPALFTSTFTGPNFSFAAVTVACHDSSLLPSCFMKVAPSPSPAASARPDEHSVDEELVI